MEALSVIRILKHCYRGYLCVSMEGFARERFLNLCMANQIVLWNIENQGRATCFCVEIRDYRRIRPLVRKTGVHVTITGRYGLPFFLHRNRRRKGYVLGIACFFMILFLMSQFIWRIQIEGNYYVTDDSILHDLETMEIHYGTPGFRINCDELEESIRNRYSEILWISARVSGTCLNIKIKENQGMETLPNKDDRPRDLIAEVGGTVTSVLVRQGRAQVKAGDSVEKGQLLVSGRIPVYNDSEEETGCQYVRADADICIRTEQTWSEQITHMETVQVDTGKARKGMRFILGHFTWVILLPDPSAEDHWEITCSRHQLVLLHDFYLPVWIDRICAKEYQVYERKRTDSEADVLKNQINNQIVQNLMEKGVQIIENNVKMLDKNTCWEVTGKLVLETPAGVGQNIEQEEEQRKADECN